jgi:hypothetical protein
VGFAWFWWFLFSKTCDFCVQYSRLDYKQHLQMNSVLNTVFCGKFTVISSGVIYYLLYLKINCIYTKKTRCCVWKSCSHNWEWFVNKQSLPWSNPRGKNVWLWLLLVVDTHRTDAIRNSMGRVFMSVFGLEEVTRDLYRQYSLIN